MNGKDEKRGGGEIKRANWDEEKGRQRDKKRDKEIEKKREKERFTGTRPDGRRMEKKGEKVREKWT